MNAWSDRKRADEALDSAVLALWSESPELLNDAARAAGVPSAEVNRVLKRYRKIR